VRRSWFTTFVYRYLSNFIITSGENVKEALVTINGLDPEKITSVAAGVDVERFVTNSKWARRKKVAIKTSKRHAHERYYSDKTEK
jgi:hypothetical protein